MGLNSNNTHATVEPLDGLDQGKKSLADQIIRLYIRGKVSEEVMNEFLAWLAGDVHMDEKDAALARLWDSIDRRASRSTFLSLKTTKSRINGVSTPVRKRLPLGNIALRVAAVLVPFIALAGVYFWFNREASTVGTEEMIASQLVVDVPNGASEYVKLHDGSEVWIKGGSKFTFPQQFDGERLVSLDGEAYFEVVAAEHPFVVKTDRTDIRVLGTDFNVVDYNEDDNVTVTLESGLIEATVGGVSYTMHQGEELRYNESTSEISHRKVDHMGSLRQVRMALNFEMNSLDEIFRAIERHFGCHIITDKPIARNMKYSTRFMEADSLQHVLNVLQSLTGQFVYEATGDAVIVTIK